MLNLAAISLTGYNGRTNGALATLPLALTTTRLERAMADEATILHDESVQARFWDKVDVRSPGDCWEWQGSVSSYGYGLFYLNPKVRIASRLSLSLKLKRVLLKGEFACHHCDNRLCVNPDRLYAGSPADNARDREERGAYYHYMKTHCIRGHAFAGDSYTVTTRGQRLCKACSRIQSHNLRRRLGVKERVFRSAKIAVS